VGYPTCKGEPPRGTALLPLPPALLEFAAFAFPLSHYVGPFSPETSFSPEDKLLPLGSPSSKNGVLSQVDPPQDRSCSSRGHLFLVPGLTFYHMALGTFLSPATLFSACKPPSSQRRAFFKPRFRLLGRIFRNDLSSEEPAPAKIPLLGSRIILSLPLVLLFPSEHLSLLGRAFTWWRRLLSFSRLLPT